MYIVLCCKLLPHLIIYTFTQEHVITTSLTSSMVHSLTLYVEVTDIKSGTPGIKTSAVESECGRIESPQSWSELANNYPSGYSICAAQWNWSVRSTPDVTFHLHISAVTLLAERVCFPDRNKLLIPVGVALAIVGLILIILLVFLLTRRRRISGYERIWISHNNLS